MNSVRPNSIIFCVLKSNCGTEQRFYDFQGTTIIFNVHFFNVSGLEKGRKSVVVAAKIFPILKMSCCRDSSWADVNQEPFQLRRLNCLTNKDSRNPTRTI